MVGKYRNESITLMVGKYRKKSKYHTNGSGNTGNKENITL
jgi:hypothetical protein